MWSSLKDFQSTDWVNTKIRHYEKWGNLKTVYLRLGTFSGKTIYIGADFDANFVKCLALRNFVKDKKIIEDTSENFHESIEELKRVFQHLQIL